MAILIPFFFFLLKRKLEDEFDSLNDIVNFSQAICTEKVPRTIGDIDSFFFPSFEKEYCLEDEFDSLKDIVNFSQAICTEKIPRTIGHIDSFLFFLLKRKVSF